MKKIGREKSEAYELAKKRMCEEEEAGYQEREPKQEKKQIKAK